TVPHDPGFDEPEPRIALVELAGTRERLLDAPDGLLTDDGAGGHQNPRFGRGRWCEIGGHVALGTFARGCAIGRVQLRAAQARVVAVVANGWRIAEPTEGRARGVDGVCVVVVEPVVDTGREIRKLRRRASLCHA